MKAWEERNWSNKNGDTSNRHRKGFIRKLLTAPGDVSLHKPLAMAEKAAYLARYRNDGLCTWISSTCMYVAFDFVASHALPASTTRDLDRPEMLPFRKHPVSADLVSVRALLRISGRITDSYIAALRDANGRLPGEHSELDHGCHYREALRPDRQEDGSVGYGS